MAPNKAFIDAIEEEYFAKNPEYFPVCDPVNWGFGLSHPEINVENHLKTIPLTEEYKADIRKALDL